MSGFVGQIKTAVFGALSVSEGETFDTIGLAQALDQIFAQMVAEKAMKAEDAKCMSRQITNIFNAVTTLGPDGRAEIKAALAHILSQDLCINFEGPVTTRNTDPLFIAIDDADQDAVLDILHDVDVNHYSATSGTTPLYHAMSNMDGLCVPILQTLLDNGAKPALGAEGLNVLHGLAFASIEDSDVPELSRVIRRCVALGADIEQHTATLKWTPLMVAISEWNLPAARALLLAGANPDAHAGDLDGRGVTALDLAANMHAAVDLLDEFQATAKSASLTVACTAHDARAFQPAL